MPDPTPRPRRPLPDWPAGQASTRLILTRGPGQVVQIGNARVTIRRTRKGAVMLAIEAPASMPILRGELIGT